jgi:membrane protein DedA with SNARE-associated domain
MHIDSLLIHYLSISRPLGYLLIFFGVMVEGDLFLLMTVFLTALGFFDRYDMLTVAALGTVAGDGVWFWLGRRYFRADNAVGRWLQHRIAKLHLHFEKKLFWKLLATKFIYGTHHVAVLALGASPMSVRRYLKSEVPATVLWVGMIGGLGLMFATSFHALKRSLHYVEIGLLLAAVIYLAIDRLLRRKLVKVAANGNGNDTAGLLG